MAVIQKGIRVRLYPNEEQEVLINKTIGCCRFVHNKTLETVNSHTSKHSTFLLKVNVLRI